MNKAFVLSIDRMTIHNGPGYRTLILFKGCGLHCVWCSTPESQHAAPELMYRRDRCMGNHLCRNCLENCPVGAVTFDEEGKARIDRARCTNCGACARTCYAKALRMAGKAMSAAEIADQACKDKGIFDMTDGGVTLSGGEPLLQDPEFLTELVKTLNERGVSVGVQTCGFVPWDHIEPLLPYVDFFYWDLKVMSHECGVRFTGSGNERIVENLRRVDEYGIPIYLRLPVIKGYTDDRENVEAIAGLASQLKNVKRLDILPMHHLGKSRYEALGRDYPLDVNTQMSREEMNQIESLIRSYGLECKQGG